jgi:hypothetical protein
MSHERPEYERQAIEYDEKAKQVTDPWVREKYLMLAKRCREMIPRGQETDSQRSEMDPK